MKATEPLVKISRTANRSSTWSAFCCLLGKKWHEFLDFLKDIEFSGGCDDLDDDYGSNLMSLNLKDIEFSGGCDVLDYGSNLMSPNLSAINSVMHDDRHICTYTIDSHGDTHWTDLNTGIDIF